MSSFMEAELEFLIKMIDSNPKYLDRVVCDFEHCIKPRYGQRFKAISQN